MFLASYLFFINAKRYELSAFILALPTAMKLYPAVFVIILLKKKRYREIAYFVLFTMLLTIISLILLKGSVSSNLQGLSDSMEWWSNRYLKDSISEVYISEDGTIVGGQPGMGVHWNTSYFAVVRLFTQYIFQIDYVDISKLYLFFCILVFGFVCYFVVFIEKQFWKQVAVLTFSMILLPWASFDYKLLHVFLPMMLFINEITNTRFDKLYSILFGFLLIPKSFINIATIRIISELYAIPALYPDRLAILPQDLNIGVIVNPVLITVMAIVIISEGISNKKIIKDSNNTD